MSLENLLASARSWIADDPDAATRAELEAVVARAEGGDDVAAADLADRFAAFLEFGTAGLRGALGAGPNRMNRVVVLRAAAGLTRYLQDSLARRDVTVVIGFDARHNSDVFAADTAAVVTAAGGRALILPRPLPTPVLAFAIRHLGADAGVMVTASHNPPQDNGYKVYLGDGSQIVPPSDVEIAAAIDTFPTAASVARAEDGWETLTDELAADYVAACAAAVGAPAADLSIVHTALHGVGSATLLEAFEAAAYARPRPVASQEQPDPEFPTVAFPNPEEPGAIDAALELARETSPDLVIASDPDADRCAVAVPDPKAATDADPQGWRMLRGDEVGALLGHRALGLITTGAATGADGGPGVVANSIVSSRLLGAMARAAGVPHEETLTGFKWIARVRDIAYGYEEALGYCTAPAVARDKDGISAALAVAELAAGLKADGRTLVDLLDDLAREHGVHTSDSFSIRVSDLALMPALMGRLREQPATQVGNVVVAAFHDLAKGDGGLPPTDGLRYLLADGTRVIVRPSGTEPKVKVYLEAIAHVDGDDLAGARTQAAERLAATRAAMEALTAL
ncbi:phospho-sugar mutase [Dermacoccus barathri]|uniref:phospho-sugar mutase n=1 Tax=Dermacoccus barathri TaxID=322601 RepID=UPI0018794F79|nr:phospho-sugar mutase [Dermacoccus barathri]MBE7370873.1 phospho-sugar mutase [Dermacoccus barathri]